MPIYEFKLPDIGEGVAEGEILKWLVSEGETVKENQPLVEVMTDKVNVEIPSPKTGKISKIAANVGEVIRVGQNLVIFEVEDAETPAPRHETAHSVQVASKVTRGEVLAAPATRKLASELGVDIQSVVGTGADGRVTVQDVQKASEQIGTTTLSQSLSDKLTEIVPLRGMRKIIAERMSTSAHSVAHVTHVDEADVTDLVLLRSKLNSSGTNAKLTFLPFIIRAVLPALKEFPYINASIDDQTQEIVLKKYYNIGIATDTDQGLVVPVIRNADSKSLYELAGEVEELAQKARTGNLILAEVQDSTFTVTNVGSIGGLFSTPLVNYPEVAILGIQRIVKKPVVRSESVVARDIMNLSLSFDHRAIDGAYAARFLNRVIDSIQNPNSL